MPQKATKESFVAKAERKYPDLYDYSRVEYVNAHTKVEIICLSCDLIFWQTPTDHTDRKSGCPDCGKNRRVLKRTHSKATFVQKAENKHPGKYDYSYVEYVNSMTKVEITCLTCWKTFWQIPNNHINLGYGCPTCGRARTTKAQVHSRDTFIAKARAKHADRYDYSLVEYKNRSTKVEIICLVCNETFWQAPSNHITHKMGCPSCGNERRRDALIHSRDDFVAKAEKKHPGLYDYSRSDYVGAKAEIEIFCLTCEQSFWQIAGNHTSQGSGCPHCRQPRGELILTRLLTERKHTFSSQQRYPGTHLGTKSYDFRVTLPSGQVLIEFSTFNRSAISAARMVWSEIKSAISIRLCLLSNGAPH